MSNPLITKVLLIVAILILFIDASSASIIVTDSVTLDHPDTMTSPFLKVIRTPIRTDEIRQQDKIIRGIFDDLKNHLSTSKSQKETHQLFNDTIIELAQHHLLPDDLSIKEAQRLVNTHPRIHPLLQRISQQHQPLNTEGVIQNTFCSVAGNTSNTHVAKLAKRIALRMYYVIDYNTGNEPLRNLATGVYIIFNELSKMNSLFLQKDGRHLGVCLYFGNYHYTPYPNWLSPAQGWIETEGLKGKQNITGTFWGQTMTGGWQPQVDWYMNYTWRGCLGFSGLIYYSGPDTVYFIGTALAVNVGPNRP
jgi:hypothetical protein